MMLTRSGDSADRGRRGYWTAQAAARLTRSIARELEPRSSAGMTSLCVRLAGRERVLVATEHRDPR